MVRHHPQYARSIPYPNVTGSLASRSNPIGYYAHPPYPDMICKAIEALNEPDGSSKKAISSYMQRHYTVLPFPQAHKDLVSHTLKKLKDRGVLAMVNKSYKLAGSTTPESVAVAAAATAAGLNVPRSENFPTHTLDPSASASQSGDAPIVMSGIMKRTAPIVQASEAHTQKQKRCKKA